MPKKYCSDTNLKNINLLNLNDEEYDDCQYVLTSPRSLQACANLEIRPIELLTKMFREFGTVEMYEDYEKKRLRKLNECIEEREKLSASNLALVGCTRPKQMALVKRRKLNWKPTLDNIKSNKNISNINNINYNNIHDTNYTNENDNNKRIMLYRPTSDDDRVVGFLKKRLETEGKMLQKQNRREVMELKQRDWKDQYGHYLEIMQNKSDLISKQHFIRRRNSSRISNERLRLTREQLRRRRPSYDDFNEKDKQTKLELRHVHKNFHDDDC
ncbi:hypothetical protein HELRODRAFT_173768 [Helobdella robusta]|uniref:Uncharacterized protein n=1 Tax=Helobdella robusta TaxID=6412 RepID=T1F775_HELRO|nr:hypothetical protein HELRODRAFT_173768 [Helobdella robusta]ESO03467.1 hypothetical protein HELRODRAFT_173768 [Helobdella robusta]